MRKTIGEPERRAGGPGDERPQCWGGDLLKRALCGTSRLSKEEQLVGLFVPHIPTI